MAINSNESQVITLSSSIVKTDNDYLTLAQLKEALDKSLREFFTEVTKFIVTGAYYNSKTDTGKLDLIYLNIKTQSDNFSNLYSNLEELEGASDKEKSLDTKDTAAEIEASAEFEAMFDNGFYEDYNDYFKTLLNVFAQLKSIVYYHHSSATHLFDKDFRFWRSRRYFPKDEMELQLLIFAIRLERLDIQFTMVNRSLSEIINSLISYIEEIELVPKSSDYPYKDILKLKAFFLLDKCLIGSNLDDAKFTYKSIGIVSFNEIKSKIYSKRSSDLLKIISLNLREKLESNDVDQINKFIVNYSSQESLCSFLKIKCLKDSNGISTQNSELLKSFDNAKSLFKESIRSTPDYKDIINTTYFGNNCISLAEEIIKINIFQQDHLSIEQINNLEESTTEIFNQITSSINGEKLNYFTYFKYILFRISTAKIRALKQPENLNAENVETLKHELVNAFTKLRDNFSNMERFQRFQLSHSDSCIETLDKFPVFILSSLNTIFNNFKEELRISELRFEINDLISRLNNQISIREIQKTKIESEKEIQNIISEVHRKNTEASYAANKKSTEILAIFSAIVIFSTNSIQLFQNVKEVKFALFLMFSFSFSILSIFSTIHLVLADGDNYKKFMEKHLKLISLTAFIMLILYWILTLIDFPKIIESENSQPQNKTTSVLQSTNIKPASPVLPKQEPVNKELGKIPIPAGK